MTALLTVLVFIIAYLQFTDFTYAVTNYGEVTIPINEPFIFNRGDGLWSNSGSTKFEFQNSDGNWVLYYNGSPFWATNTPGLGQYAKVTPDGNMVVTDANDVTQWESATSGYLATAPHRLVVDENCCYLIDSINSVIWYKGDGCAAVLPTLEPTTIPTKAPTQNPTNYPTQSPTPKPTANPTKEPTKFPTNQPIPNPTNHPTQQPIANPTNYPSQAPTSKPTANPTKTPTVNPTKNPTKNPTNNPIKSPSQGPTTHQPTADPTPAPTLRTSSPTPAPSGKTESPTRTPTEPTKAPSRPTSNPTVSPTDPTSNPTQSPTPSPTLIYTLFADDYIFDDVNSFGWLDESSVTVLSANNKYHGPYSSDDGYFELTRWFQCSEYATVTIDYKILCCKNTDHADVAVYINGVLVSRTYCDTVSSTSSYPIHSACDNSWFYLILSDIGSMIKTKHESFIVTIRAHTLHANDPVAFTNVKVHCGPAISDSPTNEPTEPTTNPSKQPSAAPLAEPTRYPTQPTKSPIEQPSPSPTDHPSFNPSQTPSNYPTYHPTKTPSFRPTSSPTKMPTYEPTPAPTIHPSVSPTKRPTKDPANVPSVSPTLQPTRSPTSNPTFSPTLNPTISTGSPVKQPTSSPTDVPSVSPTISTMSPTTSYPTISPTTDPTAAPNTASPTEPSQSPVIITTETITTDGDTDEDDFVTNTNNSAIYTFMYVATAVVFIGICVLVACIVYVMRTSEWWNKVFGEKKKDEAKEDMVHVDANAVQPPDRIRSQTVESEDSMEEMRNNEVTQWLTNVVHLPQYASILHHCGYESMRIVLTVTNVHEFVQIGIMNEAHLAILMSEINKLKPQKHTPMMNDRGVRGPMLAMAPMQHEVNSYSVDSIRNNIMVDEDIEDVVLEAVDQHMLTPQEPNAPIANNNSHESFLQKVDITDVQQCVVYNMDAVDDEIVIGDDVTKDMEEGAGNEGWQ